MARAAFPSRIRTRIAELERIILEAQAELDELRVAQRVLDRLSASGVDDNDGVEEATDISDKKSKGETVGERIVTILSASGPLTTQEIVQKLQETWRSDVAATTVSSTLSRIKKAELIDREGDKWVAKRNEAPETGASEVGGATADTSASIWD